MTQCNQTNLPIYDQRLTLSPHLTQMTNRELGGRLSNIGKLAYNYIIYLPHCSLFCFFYIVFCGGGLFGCICPLASLCTIKFSHVSHKSCCVWILLSQLSFNQNLDGKIQSSAQTNSTRLRKIGMIQFQFVIYIFLIIFITTPS